MKFYFSPGACSFAIHILFREIGQPFSLIKVDLSTHQTEQGIDYYTINPRGSVPFLEINLGTSLSEGPIIAQYICDQANRQDLMPAAGTIARYHVMEWQNYISTELHKSFSPLFNPNFDHTTKNLFTAQLKRKFEWIDKQLETSPYLTGNAFTAADAYLFTMTRWAQNMGPDLSFLTSLTNYLTRIAERPAVQQAAEIEGLKIKDTVHSA